MQNPQPKVYVYFDSNVNSALATRRSTIGDAERLLRRDSIAAFAKAEKRHHRLCTGTITAMEGGQGNDPYESLLRVAHAKRYAVLKVTSAHKRMAVKLRASLNWTADRLVNDSIHACVAAMNGAEYLLTADRDLLSRAPDILNFFSDRDYGTIFVIHPKDYLKDIRKNPPYLGSVTGWERELDRIKVHMARNGYGVP